jgi:hypothetical protein
LTVLQIPVVVPVVVLLVLEVSLHMAQRVDLA